MQKRPAVIAFTICLKCTDYQFFCAVISYIEYYMK